MDTIIAEIRLLTEKELYFCVGDVLKLIEKIKLMGGRYCKETGKNRNSALASIDDLAILIKFNYSFDNKRLLYISVKFLFNNQLITYESSRKHVGNRVTSQNYHRYTISDEAKSALLESLKTKPFEMPILDDNCRLLDGVQLCL